MSPRVRPNRCRKGHDLTLAGAFVLRADGHRICLVCRKSRPRRRPDPNRCLNGHDLSLAGAVYLRADGHRLCKACRRERARRRRDGRRAMGIPGDPPRPRMRTRGPGERQMSPTEIEAHFAQMRWEENHARPWEKSRRMWPDEPDGLRNS